MAKNNKSEKSVELNFARIGTISYLNVLDTKEIRLDYEQWIASLIEGQGKQAHALEPKQLFTFLYKLADLSVALYKHQRKVQKGGNQ